MKPKFTREEVEAIRERAATGEPHSAIGRDYRAHKTTIDKICSGLMYKWAPGPTKQHDVSKMRKLTEDQVVMLRHRYRAGMGIRKLSALYLLSSRAVEFIVHGRTYKNVGGPRAPKVRICAHCNQVLGIRRRLSL